MVHLYPYPHRSQQSGCHKYGEKLVDLVYILKAEPKGIVGVLNATNKKFKKKEENEGTCLGFCPEQLGEEWTEVRKTEQEHGWRV